MEPRTSGDKPGLAPRWSVVLRVVTAIAIGLAGAAGGGFVVHRGQVIEAFETSSSVVNSEQSKWIIKAEGILSQAGGSNAAYPTSDAMDALRKDVIQTAVELSQLRAPDSPIRTAADEYRGALEALAGALNQYDGSHQSFVTAANAMQNAANVGGTFRNQVDYYSANFLRKSLRALWWS